jgi:hypothetical protein
MTEVLSSEESLPTILWNRRPAKREHSSDTSSDEGVGGGGEDYYPASRLFEYRWPPEQERAELYFLQEQVAEFLRIRGIQRKYPDLLRRSVDVPEKKYLMSKGVVTETQSNMGLVAVRSDDVLEVMSEDFPEKYTPAELMAMPLNTAITLPEKPPDDPPPQHPVTTSQDPSTCAPATTPAGTTAAISTPALTVGGGGIESFSTPVRPGRPPGTARTKVSQSGLVCSVCYRGRASVRQEQPEPLLQCSHCQGNIHPSCLGMSGEAAEVALTYSWQCLECKTCSVCRDSGREEEMVFCDHCDRGYHTFCLSLKGIPEGRWLCMECCMCTSCGSTRGRGDKTQWSHKFVNNKFVHTLCLDCSRS